MRRHMLALAHVDNECILWAQPLILIHGDGPPGRAPGAIGADKLSEVAASLDWPEWKRLRRFPPTPQPGETWAEAALRRNREMVAMKPGRAICFHTDPNLGTGSAYTARLLQEAGIKFRVVLMKTSGEVVEVQAQ
jgi:hypothetical protein